MAQNWIQKNKPALLLAPMEGVTDAPMRALLTEFCPFTHCVTEFLRISQLVPPEKIFYRHAVEFKIGSKTPTGTPVIFQILGGNADKLAEAAVSAAKLGAPGVDLNFGCPAPTVNRHDGGATLLQYPDRIFSIVSAVRAAVPANISVSVKMRLGFDNPKSIYQNAELAEKAGASWITIHGRTKTQGYTPPAYWGPIGEVRKNSSIPVIANGEIWTVEDFLRCREETACEHFMIGRGALANPFLSHQMAKELGIVSHLPTDSLQIYPSPEEWKKLVRNFISICQPIADHPRYIISRLKQWITYIHRQRPLLHYKEMVRTQQLEELEKLLDEKELFLSSR